MVYLFITKDGNVEHFTNLKEAQELYGLGKPDMEISEKQYDEAEGLFRVIDGKIHLGKTKDELKEEKAQEKRNIRNCYLLQTDKYLIPDFPISDEKRKEIKEYRQILRDLPTEKDFPDIEVPAIPVL